MDIDPYVKWGLFSAGITVSIGLLREFYLSQFLDIEENLKPSEESLKLFELSEIDLNSVSEEFSCHLYPQIGIRFYRCC